MTMIIVIIAGGSGTRLWPLSTPSYPKHLLDVDDSDSSLLQSTYQRASNITDSVYVVSEASHVEHVRTQLPELSDDAFIVEPARRGTANCILAALTYVGNRHEAAEPIAFIHSDHYIRDVDGFVGSLQHAGDISSAHRSIVLVGVEPDYPATIFGYIQKDALLDGEQDIYTVKSFREKPDFETAEAYVASGNYLWNCGYFVGSIETFEAKMRAFAPELLNSYETLLHTEGDAFTEAYLGLQSDAIDYALIEKVEDLLVLPATFDWMDLGSFGDLHKAVNRDESGNSLKGMVSTEQVNNSFIQNNEEKPVIVIGLDDIVVVNTPHGVLVSHKDVAHKVGDLSKKLQQ
jgi:mannose-1-phosphate guanylyltransferase